MLKLGSLKKEMELMFVYNLYICKGNRKGTKYYKICFIYQHLGHYIYVLSE